MQTRHYIAAGILFAAIAGTGLLMTDTAEPTEHQVLDGTAATVYKSPSCGCCSGYITHMEAQGVDIDVVETDDVRSYKDEDLPDELHSCHTMEIGDYFVEGHVPADVVATLLKEEPDLAGIALPGMPRGSPGMGGAKSSAWTIHGVSEDGDVSTYTTY